MTQVEQLEAYIRSAFAVPFDSAATAQKIVFSVLFRRKDDGGLKYGDVSVGEIRTITKRLVK